MSECALSSIHTLAKGTNKENSVFWFQKAVTENAEAKILGWHHNVEV